jgi:hypothetical protein
MRTLELENLELQELSYNERVNTNGGANLQVGLTGLILWGVDEINQAYKEFIKGYETCKCHLNN